MAGPVERGIYLASRSPRRRELLSQIGVRFHLLLFRARPGEGPDVDEISMPGELPDLYVERMARAKAEAGWRRMLQRNLPFAPVLAADTTVALDRKIFEKPVDRRQAACSAGPSRSRSASTRVASSGTGKWSGKPGGRPRWSSAASRSMPV